MTGVGAPANASAKRAPAGMCRIAIACCLLSSSVFCGLEAAVVSARTDRRAHSCLIALPKAFQHAGDSHERRAPSKGKRSGLRHPLPCLLFVAIARNAAHFATSSSCSAKSHALEMDSITCISRPGNRHIQTTQQSILVAGVSELMIRPQEPCARRGRRSGELKRVARNCKKPPACSPERHRLHNPMGLRAANGSQSDHHYDPLGLDASPEGAASVEDGRETDCWALLVFSANQIDLPPTTTKRLCSEFAQAWAGGRNMLHCCNARSDVGCMRICVCVCCL